jgi:hypothetical protein
LASGGGRRSLTFEQAFDLAGKEPFSQLAAVVVLPLGIVRQSGQGGEGVVSECEGGLGPGSDGEAGLLRLGNHLPGVAHVPQTQGQSEHVAPRDLAGPNRVKNTS